MKKLENFQKRERELREWWVENLSFKINVKTVECEDLLMSCTGSNQLNKVCSCFVVWIPDDSITMCTGAIWKLCAISYAFKAKPLLTLSKPELYAVSCICRKRLASPEDIEYFEYQEEMMENLQENYYRVERIISKWKLHSVNHRISLWNIASLHKTLHPYIYWQNFVQATHSRFASTVPVNKLFGTWSLHRCTVSSSTFQ